LIRIKHDAAGKTNRMAFSVEQAEIAVCLSIDDSAGGWRWGPRVWIGV